MMDNFALRFQSQLNTVGRKFDVEVVIETCRFTIDFLHGRRNMNSIKLRKVLLKFCFLSQFLLVSLMTISLKVHARMRYG
jgi:hypothetical protein